jgi:hypothetical protein
MDGSDINNNISDTVPAPQDDDRGIVHIKRSTTPQDNERGVVRWKNRLKMAWYSFYSMIIFTIILWFVLPYFYVHFGIPPEPWVANITSSAEWLYITFGSVILGYMGTTAWTVRGKKIQVDEKDF